MSCEEYLDGKASLRLKAYHPFDQPADISPGRLSQPLLYAAEVSALRQAAATAVAEFNEPHGPSLALTEPDNAHEYTEPDRQPQHQQAAPQTSKKAPSQGSSEWEVGERDKDSSTTGQPQGAAQEPGSQQPDLGNVFIQRGCPPHGAKAICGRRPRMEDAYTAVPFLLEVS